MRDEVRRQGRQEEVTRDRLLVEFITSVRRRRDEEVTALRLGDWEQVLQTRGRVEGLEEALNILEAVIEGQENT